MTSPGTRSVQKIRHTENHRQTLLIFTVAAIGMAALLSLFSDAGHDQLWFLLIAGRWLHGATLYGPQLFDSNPPLIVWLSAIPVLIGRLLGVSSPVAISNIAKLLVLLAEAAVALLSLHLLRRIAPLTRTQTTWLAFAFITIFAVIPARDFGQRDHLTALLVLPYLLAAAIQPNPKTPDAPTATTPRPDPSRLLRTAIGLLAAIGICLKPHQALIPIAVELILLASPTRILTGAPPDQPVLPTEAKAAVPDERARSSGWKRSGDTPVPALAHRASSLLRPEPATIALSGLLFLAFIRRFAPGYFTLALPTLRDTYWAIGHLTPLQLLVEAPQLHLLALLTLVLFFLQCKSSALQPATTLLLAAALAATAAYYLQATGWYYQQLPAISLFSCALALLACPSDPELAEGEEPASPPIRSTRLTLLNSPWLPRAAAALSLLALALTTHFTGYSFISKLSRDRAFTVTSPDPTFFNHLPPNTAVAIITTSVEDSMMPVARYNLLWAQRTNNVWTLPAILRAESASDSEDRPGHTPRHTLPPDRLAALIRQQHAWMAEDLTRWHPQLILIARCQAPEVHCQELEDRHDNLLAWFQRDPAFRNLWQNYYYLRTSGDYDAYTRN